MILTSTHIFKIYRFSSAWKKVPHLEEKYVHESYEIIAEHFSHSRFAIWPMVKRFLANLEQDSLVFDIGCGNGKYLSTNGIFVVGSDNSLKLLEQARKNKPTACLMAADAVSIPLRSDSCDAFICIAVLHHLASRTRRERAVQ
jgi:SAM-dependent methyltransferase